MKIKKSTSMADTARELRELRAAQIEWLTANRLLTAIVKKQSRKIKRLEKLAAEYNVFFAKTPKEFE